MASGVKAYIPGTEVRASGTASSSGNPPKEKFWTTERVRDVLLSGLIPAAALTFFGTTPTANSPDIFSDESITEGLLRILQQRSCPAASDALQEEHYSSSQMVFESLQSSPSLSSVAATALFLSKNCGLAPPHPKKSRAVDAAPKPELDLVPEPEPDLIRSKGFPFILSDGARHIKHLYPFCALSDQPQVDICHRIQIYFYGLANTCLKILPDKYKFTTQIHPTPSEVGSCNMYWVISIPMPDGCTRSLEFCPQDKGNGPFFMFTKATSGQDLQETLETWSKAPQDQITATLYSNHIYHKTFYNPKTAVEENIKITDLTSQKLYVWPTGKTLPGPTSILCSTEGSSDWERIC